ncbi:MAG: DUF4349 domain-containing protein [Cyclobacteriaceae bacterium]|nr:DUF4349 domain-containing protein [Cyclobacteriaceae bacterium]
MQLNIKINLIVLLMLSLMACESDMKSYNSEASHANVALMEVADEEMMEVPVTKQLVSQSDQNTERKLIKEGAMSFQCEDVVKTKAEVDKIIKELGAYSSSEGQDSYGQNLNYHQTIRVPAEKFDALIQGLEKLAVKVESKDINTRDVTEEFIDLETRLKTKKELETRYLEILKQARSVEDVLSVEREIGNVRSEIESMEGRLNYIKNKVSFSTLNVNYYQLINPDFGFGSKLIASLSNGWENLLSFLIGIMNLWPFILLISGGTWFFIRWRRRSKAA